MSDPTDYPRDELLQRADELLKQYGNHPMVKAKVYFKATCPKCGERPTLCEPNTYYEDIECCGCGHVFPFTKGGLVLEFEPRKVHKQN